jgi:DNA-binding NarL/FixJ family response regulator
MCGSEQKDCVTPATVRRMGDFALSGSQQEPAERLRIAVADDHLAFRDAVAAWLREVCGFEVVGASNTDPVALAALARQRADLLLLGASSTRMLVPDLLRHLKSNSIAPRVVVMSMYPRSVVEMAATDAGADGTVCKNELVRELPGLLATIFGAPALSGRV